MLYNSCILILILIIIISLKETDACWEISHLLFIFTQTSNKEVFAARNMNISNTNLKFELMHNTVADGWNPAASLPELWGEKEKKKKKKLQKKEN